MLTLHLVRHAPTVRNHERRYPFPHEDPPLSPEGEALIRRLTLPPADVVFASPRLRVRQTAALAGYPEVLDAPALVEARFGLMAGLTWAELEARHGDAPRSWIDTLSDPASPHGPPGGETGQAFHGRVQAWLDALPDAGTVLAFAHSGTIQAALRLTVGLGAVVTPPGTRVTLERAGGPWWLSALVPPT